LLCAGALRLNLDGAKIKDDFAALGMMCCLFLFQNTC